ncbi:hypothetical protein ASE14_14695 [Agromyces sp. Root81]|uniref:hypothetical protein n=1 Tax=Agromyces sp. Root81 TaxID=1736601 RepID=UPI0007008A97|nr:hypothetical protein [Agromyces sp. Root81]KRC59043.1 hypothetical protein ASE14_14695 [Agromyces sp. Root81]
MSARIGWGVVVTVGTVVMLAACAPGSGFAVLDRSAGPDDELPFELPDSAAENVDLDSIRFSTEYEGERLYLAKGVTADAVCLLVVPEDHDDWSIGCGSTDGTIAVETAAGPYSIRPDGAPIPEGDTELTPNLSVVG